MTKGRRSGKGAIGGILTCDKGVRVLDRTKAEKVATREVKGRFGGDVEPQRRGVNDMSRRFGEF